VTKRPTPSPTHSLSSSVRYDSSKSDTNGHQGCQLKPAQHEVGWNKQSIQWSHSISQFSLDVYLRGRRVKRTENPQHDIYRSSHEVLNIKFPEFPSIYHAQSVCCQHTTAVLFVTSLHHALYENYGLHIFLTSVTDAGHHSTDTMRPSRPKPDLDAEAKIIWPRRESNYRSRGLSCSVVTTLTELPHSYCTQTHSSDYMI
jgi:hypothetical protein